MGSESGLVMVVRNKCTACKHKWRDQPGTYSVTTGKCPKCRSLYFKWSSYEFDIKKNKLDSSHII